MNFKRYMAIVVDNQDPDQLGRIKVACPDFMGGGKKDETLASLKDLVAIEDWVDPVLDWGWFYVPDIDEMVEIEIQVTSTEDEVPFESAIMSPNIRWRGKRFWGGEKTEAPRPIPDDMKTNYGKRRGLITPGGHVVLFDDTPGKSMVRISWHDKEGEEDFYSFIALDETGSIVLANKAGTTVYLDAKNKAFTVLDEHGNTIATDANGSKIIDKFGNIIQTKDGVVEVISQGGVNVTAANTATVTCDKAILKTALVELGDGADTPAVRGQDWKDWASAHTHPTGTGPSGPPTEPILPAVLSTVVKLK